MLLQELYREEAKRFIKTVACIDNQAFFPLASGVKTDANRVAKIAESSPPGIPIIEIEKEEKLIIEESKEIQIKSDIEEVLPQSSQIEADNDLELDAKALIDSFADLGIICSVSKPFLDEEDPVDGEEEKVLKEIQNLAQAADVIILDWHLSSVYPNITIKAIEKILTSDKQKGERLRLILVYSAELYSNIAERITQALNPLEIVNHPVEVNRIRVGEHTNIVICQKTDTGNTFNVPPNELPTTIINEFAKLTNGLLPTMALKAVTSIREHTHQLIAKFPKKLDAAFIAHRALIADPNDAESFLIDLISSEIKNIIQYSEITGCVDGNTCIQWLKENGTVNDENSAIWDKLMTQYARNSNEIKGIIEYIVNQADLTDRENFEHFQNVINLICTEPDNIASIQEEFSKLSALSLSRDTLLNYSTYLPRLTFGTIISIGNNPIQYFLCLQPLCDTIRLPHNKNTSFPFLKIAISGEYSTKSFNATLSSGQNVWFEVDPKPNKMEMILFKAHSIDKGFVQSKKEIINDRATFAFKSSSQSYEWVAELKIGKTQQIVSQIASRMSTLGIDEYEWLRLANKTSYKKIMPVVDAENEGEG